jgi:hypothetical protein
MIDTPISTNITQADAEMQAILTKYQMKYGYSFEFPRYRQLPDEVRLALSVLQTHGLQVNIIITPIDEKKA